MANFLSKLEDYGLRKFKHQKIRRAFQQAENSNEQECLTLANIEENFRKITTTRIIFDGGSEISFISSKLIIEILSVVAICTT
ncbi:hypothetical protein DERP_002938 [Dermatophagoides pteronyssinus]|uniref:Uncharacterized protein n=1 Tax=Dermatophagoides pteronyssinus TaxID=6956 RepID=A0ABQ8JW56_DERPT|nr:hypothetical protein DERP_002938 [Dermatophagoides pteronyssinus]